MTSVPPVLDELIASLEDQLTKTEDKLRKARAQIAANEEERHKIVAALKAKNLGLYPVPDGEGRWHYEVKELDKDAWMTPPRNPQEFEGRGKTIITGPHANVDVDGQMAKALDNLGPIQQPGSLWVNVVNGHTHQLQDDGTWKDLGVL